MIRLYFDSNVFRYLKNENKNLFEDLVSRKKNIIYFYSYAHLSDLRRDSTDRKFDDLKFMELLVENNYLSLGKDDNIVSPQKVNPIDAFQGLDFTPLKDIMDSLNLEEEMIINENDTIEEKRAKILVRQYFEKPIKEFGIDSFHGFIDEETPIDRMIPKYDENISLFEFTKIVMSKFDDIHEDPTIWRDVRKYSVKELGLKNFDIDINDLSFNEKLKDTPLQKSFLEFVEESFNHNKDLDKQRQFNFFISAYNCLNILGLDNERKVVFSSSQADAQHAYYAAHCDIFVTNDKQLLLKSRVLYKMFGIETKALSLEEFLEYENIEKEIKIESSNDYLKLLIKELQKNEIINLSISSDKKEQVTTYKLDEPHFGFFNRIDLMAEGDSTCLTIYKQSKNYSSFTSFKEFRYITNRLFLIYGEDVFGEKEFLLLDEDEILEDNWNGRTWKTENIVYHLGLGEESKRLCLYIFLKSHNNI